MTCRALLVAILAGLLSACTTLPDKPIDDRHWTMQGKLSARIDGRTRIVSIDWLQSSDESNIVLSGPFGSGAVKLRVSPDGAWADEGEGEVRLDDLLAAEMSVQDLPWQQLSYWVRGIDASGRPLPTPFESGFWVMEILKKDENGPVLMTFTRDEFAVRLKVLKWAAIAETDRL